MQPIIYDIIRSKDEGTYLRIQGNCFQYKIKVRFYHQNWRNQSLSNQYRQHQNKFNNSTLLRNNIKQQTIQSDKLFQYEIESDRNLYNKQLQLQSNLQRIVTIFASNLVYDEQIFNVKLENQDIAYIAPIEKSKQIIIQDIQPSSGSLQDGPILKIIGLNFVIEESLVFIRKGVGGIK
ncbi:hypothetical protein pb186bvf_019090 [Paramecium bursaria]